MKKISLLLFYIVFSMATFTQNEVNTTFSTTMNATFGNLDKTKVPHGILLGYNLEFATP